MKLIKFLTQFFLIGLLFTVSTQSFSQEYNSGPQIFSFHSDVDDTEQPYACYIPNKYNPKKAYALVVMLHGAGSNHRLAMRRVFGKSNANGENDVEASLYFPNWKSVDYIVVSPYARGTMGYQGIAEKDVWDMLADVKSRFKIDANRTFLTGLSMGGGGTMWIGLTRPDVWAAIAPVCPAPPLETKQYLDNASNLKVHFFQGGADPVVKPEGTREWVAEFKKVGSDVTYQEFPDVKHDSWVNAYANEFIFSWFDKIKRNPFPNKVKFTTAHLKYNKAYWMTVNEFSEAGKPATIEGYFKMKNVLDVKTTNVNTFSLNLFGHGNFNPKKSVVLNVDGQNLTVFGLRNGQVLTKKADKWQVAKLETSPDVKSKNLEGPMAEVMSDRHIYVYGTADNPSKEVLEKRRLTAEEAANWSFYRGDFMGRVMVFPRVLSDKEVRASDEERSHLVLFGTKATNSIIAKLSSKLPMQLEEKATETASLAYVYPNGKRYVLINSGLPFWEIPEKDNGPFGRLRTVGKVSTLTGYGDYVFYDKSLNNVVASSIFDNNWKLSEADLKILKSSTKVLVK